MRYPCTKLDTSYTGNSHTKTIVHCYRAFFLVPFQYGREVLSDLFLQGLPEADGAEDQRDKRAAAATGAAPPVVGTECVEAVGHLRWVPRRPRHVAQLAAGSADPAACRGALQPAHAAGRRLWQPDRAKVVVPERQPPADAAERDLPEPDGAEGVGPAEQPPADANDRDLPEPDGAVVVGPARQPPADAADRDLPEPEGAEGVVPGLQPPADAADRDLPESEGAGKVVPEPQPPADAAERDLPEPDGAGEVGPARQPRSRATGCVQQHLL